MILKEIYHKEFMRRKVDEQYLQKYENVIVLGERFIEQYYVVVFQVEKDRATKYYILIENIKKAELIELERFELNRIYVVFNKKRFEKQVINERLLKKIYKNGLFKKIEIGLIELKDKNGKVKTVLNKKKESLWDLNRLVVSLYQNILGFEIHHIDEDPMKNHICNLLKIEEKLHDWLHNHVDDYKKRVQFCLEMQNKQKKKICTKHRNTLAQREELTIEKLKGIISNEKKEK